MKAMKNRFDIGARGMKPGARLSLGSVMLVTLMSAIYCSFGGDKNAAAQTADLGKAESHYREAEQALERKDAEAALGSLEKAISLEPASAKYLRKYGDTVVAAAAYARGVGFLTPQADRTPTADIHFQIGRIAMERYRRDPDPKEKQNAALTGIQHLSQAINLDQKHWEARLLRGIIYHYIPVEYNQMGEAIADFEWLVKERPGLAIAYRYLADSYAKLKEVDRARAVLSEAVKRFPDDQKLRERLKRLTEAGDASSPRR